MNPDPAFWAGRSVLVTGHTGFKGSWLTLWLSRLGAVVHGYALAPPTSPSLFEAAGVAGAMRSDTRGDIGDLAALTATLQRTQPEVVMHLAAQPLVLDGYKNPCGTIQTNVVGTANVLEAVRMTPSVKSVLVVTTDKVYENAELALPFTEFDRLGGCDPYSGSKAAAEIVTTSYRLSFFQPQTGSCTRVATARSGNVIGGGDWASDRLVPDCLKAFANNEVVSLRRPESIRPWQHVLDPLAGYLMLAERLAGDVDAQLPGAWNFGPDVTSDATVAVVAEMIARLWGDGARVAIETTHAAAHEAGVLRLDSTRSRQHLGWAPRWALNDALTRTVVWHRAWLRGADMAEECRQELAQYEAGGNEMIAGTT